MLSVLAAFVFLGVGLIAYVILDLALSDDMRVSRRLKGLTAYEQAQAKDAQPLLKPFRQRVVAPAASSLAGGVRSLWPPDYRDRVKVKLTRAGNPGGVYVTRFLLAKVTAAIGAAGLIATLAYLMQWKFGMAFLVMVIASLVAFLMPDVWLAARIDSRQRTIVRELPDMLDMLTISVQAGLGFDAALSKLVRNGRGPLAQEFGRSLQEVQAGASRKEALRHMAERVDVAELSAFTSAIIQADIFGISIAQVLRTQAGEMRLRRRQRAEEQAQKAPVKMVMPLVLCILPATIIVVAGPAVVRMGELFG